MSLSSFARRNTTHQVGAIVQRLLAVKGSLKGKVSRSCASRRQLSEFAELHTCLPVNPWVRTLVSLSIQVGQGGTQEEAYPLCTTVGRTLTRPVDRVLSLARVGNMFCFCTPERISTLAHTTRALVWQRLQFRLHPCNLVSLVHKAKTTQGFIGCRKKSSGLLLCSVLLLGVNFFQRPFYQADWVMLLRVQESSSELLSGLLQLI
jgi:hypothetical protein